MLHQKEDVKIKIYLSSAVSFTLSRSSATQMLHPGRVKMLQGLKRELMGELKRDLKKESSRES